MVLLLAAAGTLTTQSAHAQVNISINIGSQPAWGPTGHDHVDYYYLPDINCYYDIAREQFLYLSNGRWLYARTLPRQYGNYDLYSMYKVIVNQSNPYLHNATHLNKYGQYKGNRSQPNIRDSREEKYYASKGHPNHSDWTSKQNTDRNTENNLNEQANSRKEGAGSRNQGSTGTAVNNRINAPRQQKATERSNNDKSTGTRNSQSSGQRGR